MTAPTRRLRSVPGVIALVAMTLAGAPAQQPEDCPPQSRAPQCVASDAEDTTTTDNGATTAPTAPTPAQSPDRGQAPTTPPGRDTEPATRPQPAENVRPDGGSGGGQGGGSGGNAPSSPAGPSRTGGSDGPAATPGADGPSDPEAEVDANIPPPPPDLGARRVIETRLSHGSAGLQVAVDVEEARARGVDGGWTVTITGAPGSDTAVDAWAGPADGPVGLILGRTPRSLGAPPGFTVVGQRSTTVYDARYQGLLPVGPFRPGTPAVITVTLFQ